MTHGAPNKQFVTDISASALHRLPSKYIRPSHERPAMSAVAEGSGSSIPLIDLAALHGPHRSNILRHIDLACRTHGFFQVKNHGVPVRVMENMMRIAREFFRLPEDERMKMYSSDVSKTTRLSTSFNVNTEKVANWRDYLRLHCYPLQDYINEWPSNPPTFREEVAEYCSEARGVVVRLVEAISESLGLEKEYITSEAIGKHGQHMALNYYPPCPQPELTYGLPAHTDPNLITLLLQDDVPGLQVLQGQKWVAIQPIPNTFIVNIGDQMQVISNGRYKSVLHRAVVNCQQERISIPTFYCPSPDAVIKPAPKLVTDFPALYKSYTYAEYYSKFWDKGLKADSSALHLFKINN
uniref:Fe2OG dioxygenase domain-containing protein n=2 Tax=Kalanchoe fedtschenkoi TaxID=63787 RepID=A0A7N0TRM5_KALFE